MKQTPIYRIICYFFGWLYLLFICLSGNDVIAQTQQAHLSPQAEIGKLLFFDPRISGSGKLACATCHDPSNAHAPNNNLAVQVGGIHLDQPYFRATPSIRYLAQTPAFHIESKNKPVGGFNRDASADSLAKQAEGPLLSPTEMANSSMRELIVKVKLLPYIKNINSAFTLNSQSSDQQYFDAILIALEKYQKEDPAFQPFTSKFDLYLKGKINLSSQELRGFEVFNNTRIGNCASCHSSKVAPDGQAPLFTDFSYDALGVPRNMGIASNQNSDFFDMGLCQSHAGKDHPEFCGMFKTPTLRNVATRKVFFHNGKYTSLREAIRFYATRDTDPEKWYGRNAEGGITKFNDLPKEYRDNVSRDEAPYDQHFGRIPRISEEDIADIEAFLTTLTDGYDLNSSL
jgi:cytochrome c peroxidase